MNITEIEYNRAYNQGVDHAYLLAQTISKHYNSTSEFLIEFFIQVNRLKELQAKDITPEEIASVINKN